MSIKDGNNKEIYINEIIRITYKCNWQCKFCNVLKTNNFGDQDIISKDVIYQILSLSKKYTSEQRKNLILSFSGGEPTLDKNLFSYIKLAKSIGIGLVEIQTNGTQLFKEKKYILDLIQVGLDSIFLAQHSGNENINKELGNFYNIEDFKDWVDFILKNDIHKKIDIYLNIVITKINLFYVGEYIQTLIQSGFLQVIPEKIDLDGNSMRKISFGFVQPNGYALLNKDEVLLKYTDEETEEIKKVVELCKCNSIFPDFHFVSPPLCVLDYPEYNLEYERLKSLEENKLHGVINESNLESYKKLWKEKQKMKECTACKYNNYCLGFYKNWISFVGEEYVKEKIQAYILKNKSGG